VWPDGFWWGTGNSSNQCEGAAPASDWLRWEQAGRAPSSGDGNGFAARHAEDFALLKEVGLGHFRISIEWARVEPREGEHDRAEIERYRAMLQTAKDLGLHIWVCAHHFSLPRWVSDAGGFLDPHIATKAWPRHIAFLADTFGDLVYGWKPINEPWAYASISYLIGTFPPGKTDVALTGAALQAVHLANFEAARILRGDGPVSTVHALSPCYPASDATDDIEAAAFVDELIYGCWIRAITEGEFRLPELPGGHRIEGVKDPSFTEAFDVIGFSYYSASTYAAAPELASLGGVLPGNYPPDGEVGMMGYVAWPDGLQANLRRLHRDLPGRDLLISEYGIGTLDDRERQRYLRDGVRIAKQALDDGVRLRGFFHWTGVDNYEWLEGFTAPFGLIDRDRTPRPSAELLRFYAAGGRPGEEPTAFR
jgi:beta-glucosidase